MLFSNIYAVGIEFLQGRETKNRIWGEKEEKKMKCISTEKFKSRTFSVTETIST